MRPKVQKGILLLLVLMSLTNASSLVAGQSRVIKPTDGSFVPWQPCLTGVTDDPTAEHIAVVHPLQGDFHVQRPITVRSDGWYKVILFVGDEGLHQNQLFEIRVFRKPRRKYRQGEILKTWPAAVAETQLIEVTRRDSAPSGCESASAAPDPSATDSRSAANPAAVPNVADTARQFPARENSSQPFFLTVALWFTAVMMLLLFVAMTALQGRAKAANDYVGQSLASFRQWLSSHQNRRAVQFGRIAVRLLIYGLRHVKAIWGNRGFTGNLGGFAEALLLGSLLLGLALIASVVDAKATAPALTAMFGRPAAAGASTFVFTEPSDNQPADGSVVSPNAAVVGSPPKPFAARVVADMVRLWTEEPNGPFAIGIACVQAAFGLILLSGFPLNSLPGLTPARIYRERPLLLILFMILNLGLAALAAYRAFELSTGDHWVLPCLVAGAVGFGMPWVMAYSLHFGTGYAVQCMGVLLSTTLALCVAHLDLLAQMALLVVLIILLGPLYFAFALVFLFRFAVGLWLWMAMVLGDLARETSSAWSRMPLQRPAGVAGALAGTMALALTGYALSRWLA